MLEWILFVLDAIHSSFKVCFPARPSEIIPSSAGRLSLPAHTTPCQEGDNPALPRLQLEILWCLQPGRISLLTA